MGHYPTSRVSEVDERYSPFVLIIINILFYFLVWWWWVVLRDAALINWFKQVALEALKKKKIRILAYISVTFQNTKF